MLAVHEELTRPRVMAAVEDLGKQGASGVLEISGSPSGAIYLDGGYITFARATWVPGLSARVRGVCPSPAALAELAAWDADDAAVAALALRRGYLTGARLHELIRSIVLDALLVLAIPLVTDAPVAAIRFVSTRTYWTDMFPRLAIPSMRTEAVRRARRLADYGLSPTTAVALCDLRRAGAVVTREQWTVARTIIEHASARDIALRDGTSLTDTADCLGALIRAGVCVPLRASERRQLGATEPGAVHDAVRDALPTRRTRSDRSWPAPVGIAETRMEQSPSADVLRQVLNGLKRLS